MADLTTYAAMAGNIAIMVIVAVIGAAAVGGVVWGILKYKKYSQFRCIVWERDGFGQLVETIDSAGIFVDGKTKNKRFFMRRANVGLEPDNIPYIKSGRAQNVYLFRTGLKNFRFIKPRFEKDIFSFQVGEEDVNWSVNAYERQKRLFNQNMLLQYMPFILLAFVSIIILIIFIYFFKNFDTLAEVAKSLNEAASAYAAAQSGTTVIG